MVATTRVCLLILMLLGFGKTFAAQGSLALELDGAEQRASSASRSQAYHTSVGTHLSLRFIVSNLDPSCSSAHIPGLDAAKILSEHVSNESSMTQINGKITRNDRIIKVIDLVFNQEGSYRIGPVACNIAGSKVVSNELALVVGPASKSVSAKAGSKIYAELSTGKAQVYEGEPFLLKCRLCSAVQIMQYQLAQPSFADFETRGQGRATQHSESINGTQYAVIEFFFTLVAIKPGSYTIPPCTVQLALADRSSRGFGGFFSFAGLGYTQHNETSNACDITVLPLPATNKKLLSVGEFSQPVMSVQSNKAAVGELITVRLKIEGSGNFDYMQAPDLTLPDGLSCYDPVVHESLETRDGAQVGSKTFEYIVRAQEPGSFTIPSQHYAFFDPQHAHYVKYSTKPITLEISGSAQQDVVLPKIASLSDNAAQEDAPAQDKEQDIHFIVSHPFGSVFCRTRAFSWQFLLILMIFMVACVLLPRVQYVARHVERICAWARIFYQYKREFATQKHPECLYNFFKSYFALRTRLPVTVIERQDIQSFLERRGWQQDEVKAFMLFLAKCAEVSFAGRVVGAQESAQLFIAAQHWFARLFGRASSKK